MILRSPDVRVVSTEDGGFARMVHRLASRRAPEVARLLDVDLPEILIVLFEHAAEIIRAIRPREWGRNTKDYEDWVNRWSGCLGVTSYAFTTSLPVGKHRYRPFVAICPSKLASSHTRALGKGLRSSLEEYADFVVVHELVHVLVWGLGLPVWVQEGLAAKTEEVVVGKAQWNGFLRDCRAVRDGFQAIAELEAEGIGSLADVLAVLVGLDMSRTERAIEGD